MTPGPVMECCLLIILYHHCIIGPVAVLVLVGEDTERDDSDRMIDPRILFFNAYSLRGQIIQKTVIHPASVIYEDFQRCKLVDVHYFTASTKCRLHLHDKMGTLLNSTN